jgi:hypothetical protein
MNPLAILPVALLMSLTSRVVAEESPPAFGVAQAAEALKRLSATPPIREPFAQTQSWLEKLPQSPIEKGWATSGPWSVDPEKKTFRWTSINTRFFLEYSGEFFYDPAISQWKAIIKESRHAHPR